MTRNAHLYEKFCLNTLAAIAMTAALAWLAGCNTNGTPKSDQQLQQDAAKTSEQVKQGAKEAAADARVAAADGVKQGLHSNDKPSPGVTSSGAIDINSASATELETLPGISASRAQHI